MRYRSFACNHLYRVFNSCAFPDLWSKWNILKITSVQLQWEQDQKIFPHVQGFCAQEPTRLLYLNEIPLICMWSLIPGILLLRFSRFVMRMKYFENKFSSAAMRTIPINLGIYPTLLRTRTNVSLIPNWDTARLHVITHTGYFIVALFQICDANEIFWK